MAFRADGGHSNHEENDIGLMQLSEGVPFDPQMRELLGHGCNPERGTVLGGIGGAIGKDQRDGVGIIVLERLFHGARTRSRPDK